MSKVWNIVGSFIGGSNLIPENATFTKLEVLPQSLDTYYNGETFRWDLTFFQATFASDEGEVTKITIPSKEVKAKNFVPEVPFTNTLDHEITRHLEFEWTYIPAGADKDDPLQHQTKDCPFEITIWPEKFTVKTVEVIVPPSKTIYYDGETFNHAGMVVQATSEEGDTKNIEYCGSASCSEDRDCYYYNTTPLHAGDSETVDVLFTYCVPADGDHPNGYIAQFTYPVTVYRDERKAQLKVTYDADTTVRKYYSGEKFNSEGIKVQKKYPRDDESAYDDPNNTVTSQCRIYVQEFPNGVLQYNDSNGGYLNVVVEYYDPITKLTTTEVVPNIVFVYEVAQVQVAYARKKEFYIGDPFDSSLATLRVDYKPSSLPLDDYSGYIMSNDYSWTRTEYIDSTGKFLKAGQNIELQLNYYDENDPKSPKTVHSTTYLVNVMKQVFKLKVPEYTGDETYEMGTDGVKILRYLGVTSGTSLSQGYQDISVNGTWNYGTPSKIDKYYTASSSQYQYEIGVRGKLEDDTYSYVWDDGYNTPGNEVKYVQVNLKILVSQTVSLSASADTTSLVSSDSGYEGSSSTSVSVDTGGQGIPSPTTFRASESSNYLSVSPSYIEEDYSGDFTVSVTSNSNYSGTKNGSVTFKADSITQDDGWRELTTTFNSDTVNFSIKYKDPWDWNDSVTAKWFTGLGSNNPSSYLGEEKTFGSYTWTLVKVSGSQATFACIDKSGRFGESYDDWGDWSTGALTIQEGCHSMYKTMNSATQNAIVPQQRYAYNTVSSSTASRSMSIFPFTAEEIGCGYNSSVNTTGRYSRISGLRSYMTWTTEFWVGNSADGDGVSNPGRVAAMYQRSWGEAGSCVFSDYANYFVGFVVSLS